MATNKTSVRKKSNKTHTNKSVVSSKVGIPRWVVVLFVAIVALVGIVFIYNSYAIGGPNGDTPPNRGSRTASLFAPIPTQVFCANGHCTLNGNTGRRFNAFKRPVGPTGRCPSGYEYRLRQGNNFKSGSNWSCLERYLAAPGPATGNIVDACGIQVDASIQANVCALLNEAHRLGYNLGGSGYRDTAGQRAARDRNGCPDYTSPSSTCRVATAPVGTSMHERGLAIDFTCGTSACWSWLASNAGRFGLHNLPGESWHYSINGN